MSVEISVLIAVGGLILSYLGYQLNAKKDMKSDIQESAILKTELDHIRDSIDHIRIDLKSNEKQMEHLGERVTRVEESSKQAHKRMDHMENGE